MFRVGPLLEVGLWVWFFVLFLWGFLLLVLWCVLFGFKAPFFELTHHVAFLAIND